jgi:hypothetical protein
MKRKSAVMFAVLFLTVMALNAQSVDMKKEYATTLTVLTDALLKRQVTDAADPFFGAISCSHCTVFHTRAAEAVYPFSVMYTVTRDAKYRERAVMLGNWLIRQQEKNGSWKETPEEWTGTTTDQLLMMMLAYNILEPKLRPAERTLWKQSMEKAAEYLTAVMSPEFASINYVATTTATLAAAHAMFKKEIFAVKARELAHRVVSKMDEDGFINGEGGRTYTNKSGVDLGYDLEMSLWGLGYYARLTNDTLVNRAVKDAVKMHLYFIYPDGSMDGSWGIRSNKWTTYGGGTSDGCQVLFQLFADEDARYAAASLRNLQFLRKNMKDGIVGYGPHHWELFDTQPCIYPTFAKAKNIAFAYSLEMRSGRTLAPLPTEQIGWTKYFSTLDIAQVRTAEFMSTVTAYGYEDQARSKSKYMNRPSGGAISNLWVKDHGYLQASSVTKYSRSEPMHFPEAPGIRSLTPRIEFTDSTEYFTNLYEFNASLNILPGSPLGVHRITTTGEMKNSDWQMGGVRYNYLYEYSDSSVRKTVTLRYHDQRPLIRIIEPVIQYPGMSFERLDDRSVLITAGGKKFLFSLTDGDAELIIGREKEKYWAPYPALKAFPIELEVKAPVDGFIRTVSYSFTILK